MGRGGRMGNVHGPQEEVVPLEALKGSLIFQRLGHWKVPLRIRRGKECSVHPKASKGVSVPREKLKTGCC